jgi:hypothetical protein
VDMVRWSGGRVPALGATGARGPEGVSQETQLRDWVRVSRRRARGEGAGRRREARRRVGIRIVRLVCCEGGA